MQNVVFMIHLILTIVLVGVILVQRSDADGMGGLSGGGGGGNALFSGRGKATFLTRLTAMLAAAFFATSIGLAYLSYQQSGTSIMDSVPATGAPAAERGGESKPAETPAVPKAE